MYFRKTVIIDGIRKDVIIEGFNNPVIKYHTLVLRIVDPTLADVLIDNADLVIIEEGSDVLDITADQVIALNIDKIVKDLYKELKKLRRSDAINANQ